MSIAYTPVSTCGPGLSMNKTCFESSDHDGMTQQPSVVNWRSSGVGVGLIVGVGCGVAVSSAVGKTTAVGVAGNSVGLTGVGSLTMQATKSNIPITHHATRSTRRRTICSLL